MTDDITHTSVQTIKDLQLNHTYLIRYGSLDTLHSIKVLLITDKAYHIKWNGNNETWELKEKLYHDYTLVEDISDFVVEKQAANTTDNKIKYIPCYVCKGFGTIPDAGSTSGSKLCPLCHGGKMIVGEITSEL